MGSSEAWFMPPLKRNKGERRPLVIFFHGNGEVIDYLPEQAEGFRELGLGVLLVEYPGSKTCHFIHDTATDRVWSHAGGECEALKAELNAQPGGERWVFPSR